MSDSLFGGLGSGISNFFSGNKKDYLTGVNSDGTKYTINADDIGTIDQNTITGKFSTGAAADIGGMAQLGGLAISSLDGLFGSTAKANKQALANAKVQGQLLKQQLETNTQSIADKKAFNSGMANASAKAMGLGSSLTA